MKTFSDLAARAHQRRPAAQIDAARQRHDPAGADNTRGAAQRERIDSAFGPAAQRVEDEEMLQGKFDPAQRMEEEEPLQGKFAPVQRVEEEELLQGKFAAAQPAPAAAANRTGMPDGLKSGIESMSGMDLSDVRVHRDSDAPAQLDAHAYAQGNDIHLAPGQEQHLPHEAWHVVQQRQGRVQPTMQMGSVNINDDAGLEAEADVMGAKALQTKAAQGD